MSTPESDFVRRIRDYRVRGRETRERAEFAFASATAEMSRLVGAMAAFKAMDSDDFPVRADERRVSADLPEPPEFGASVTALRRDGGCSRVVFQARTSEGDEFATLSLSAVGGSLHWVVDQSSNGFDGSEDSSRTEHASAKEAVSAFRSAVLSTAVRALSGAKPQDTRPLPDRDEECVHAVQAAISAAMQARRAAEDAKQQRRSEIARTGHAVRVAWQRVSRALSFLQELEYVLDGEGEGNAIVATSTVGGVCVRVSSGGFWADISAEATVADPAIAVVSIRDCNGRREERGAFPVSDEASLARELADAVLDEIEAAEAAWLPQNEPEREPHCGPSM